MRTLWPQLHPCSNPRTSLYTIPQCVHPRVGAFLVRGYKGDRHSATLLPPNSTENDRRLSPDQDLNLIMADADHILDTSDIMALVVKEMDLNSILNARAVCKSWRRFVQDANLNPLEAGCSEQQRKLGLENQQRMEAAFAQENQVWTAAHTAKLAQHLTKQQAITGEIRHKLVNWLIEVHFKNNSGVECCLYLTIQLLDLFLANDEVARNEFQTLGVAAFKLACNYTKASCFSLSKLSFITDYSSTEEDITAMEQKIVDKLQQHIADPNPIDFLLRFSQAANLEFTKDIKNRYSKPSSIMLYFIDMALLNETLAHTRRSLIAAAAIMCTLRVLGKGDWSETLRLYTTYTRETVAALANMLIENGRVCTVLADTLVANGGVFTAQPKTQIAHDRAGITWAITIKYTSERLGGKGNVFDSSGKALNNGCLHMLCDCYEIFWKQ